MPRYNTTIDDTSPLIIYSTADQWHPGTSRDPEANRYFGGGTFTFTNATGATATFTFNGTGVWLYGAKRSNHGPYSVTLDGAKYDYSGHGNDEFQVTLFSASGLTMSAHEVVLTNEAIDAAEMYLDLDFVSWETELGQDDYTLNHTTVQATSASSSFQFSGSGWRDAINDNALVDTGIFTDVPGDSVAFEFEGEAVSIFGSIGTIYGLFDVRVDGGTATTYNATRQQNETSQLLFYGANLGSGPHVLQITNSQNNTGDSANQIFMFDHAEVMTATSRNASTYLSNSQSSSDSTVTTSSKDSNMALIGGLCGALAFMLLLLGLLLWLYRRRRLARNTQHVPSSKLDLDDDIPLQTRPHSQPSLRTAMPDTVLSLGSHMPYDSSHSDFPSRQMEASGGGRPPGSRTPHDSSRTVSGSRLPLLDVHGTSEGRNADANSSSSGPKRDGYASRNASSSRLPDDGLSSRRTASGSGSRQYLPHVSFSRKSGSNGRPLPSHRSQNRSKKNKNKNKNKPRTGNQTVIRMLPLPPLPQAPASGSTNTMKGQRRSLRNSRIPRAGYNIFFARPGSSNSSSAYAPSIVLTSEISERPATTLSPVTEAPPPLPSTLPQGQIPQRTLQIANRTDE